MKYHLIITVLFFAFSLFSQEKGVSPLEGGASVHPEASSAQTYAVVVGISDYQDEGIPDLRFADKDALAFAGFLQSPAGGSLDEDHLKVLLNEKATVAQFAIQLDWLLEVAGENDRVMLYFSGHGDVERKTITQPGYLLCWDAPSRIYLAGGALALPMFQDVITTLSAQNKAKVVVITDACRSGKLSGSSVGGAQITGSNLAKQYANEIKILSCQPDEFSIEGEQWGGGRGAFSYHLLDGLYGMADKDSDQSVSLREIDRYLEDHVAPEVAPHNQLPMVIGDSREKLTDVFPEILAQLEEAKKGEMPLFTATESRGIEDDVLAAADTNIVEMYHAFQNALADKHFLFAEEGKAENDYAEFYYGILSQEAQLERLHSSMRRNYAAALQDDAQQVLNEWMKTGLSTSRFLLEEFTQKVRSFPACIERAAELLGKDHYMYTTLQSRKYFFEGYILVNSNQTTRHTPQQNLGRKALEKFLLALEWQPELPHAYWQMMNVYGFQLLQPDSAEIYAQKAIALYPSWIVPHTRLAYMLCEKYHQFERAKPYLEQGMLIDSNSVDVWHSLGVYYYRNGEWDLAAKHYKKVIQFDSTYIWAYHALGVVYSDYYYNNLSEQYYKKAIQIDSTFAAAYAGLGNLYIDTRQYDLSEEALKKAIQIDSNYRWAYYNLGNLYKNMHQYDLSEEAFKKAIQIDSSYLRAYKGLGNLYKNTYQYDLSEEAFKKVIQLDSSYLRAYADLGNLYKNTHQYDLSEEAFKKVIQLDSAYIFGFYELSKLYYEMGRPDEAEKNNHLNLKFNSADPRAYYNVACLKSLYQEPDEAFHSLEEALKKGYDNFKWLQEDEDLANLRKQKKRWDALMKKYFPDQHKN